MLLLQSSLVSVAPKSIFENKSPVCTSLQVTAFVCNTKNWCNVGSLHLTMQDGFFGICLNCVVVKISWAYESEFKVLIQLSTCTCSWAAVIALLFFVSKDFTENIRPIDFTLYRLGVTVFTTCLHVHNSACHSQFLFMGFMWLSE